MRRYFAEDVFLMSREFALRTNWFLEGHRLSFEDVHICQQPGICELAPEIQRLTRFPLYFNHRRVYHLPHRTFYYQLLDDEFTSGLLRRESSDDVIAAHKTAIERYRRGEFTFRQALAFTRQNAGGTGTQNLNYRYHMQYLSPLADATHASHGKAR